MTEKENGQAEEQPVGEISAPSGVPELGEPERNRRTITTTAAVWTFTGVCLLLIVGLVARAVTRDAKPLSKPPVKLSNVEVMTVQGIRYEEELILPAKLVADREAAVSSEVPGLLARWLVPEGAQVAEGEVVAELDTSSVNAALRELQAQENSVQAAVESARKEVQMSEVAARHSRQELQSRKLALKALESDLELAEKEVVRARRLTEEKVQTQAELDIAENRLTQRELAVEQAREAIGMAEIGVQSAEVNITKQEAAVLEQEARLEETRARIEALRIELAKSSLTAPINGRLEAYLAQPGEVISVSQPLAKIYDLSHIRAQVDVADRFAPFLEKDSQVIDQFVAYSMPGAERQLSALVILPGLPKLTGGTYRGLELPAEIYLVAQAADVNSNTFRVELRLENPGGALKQGILGQARITYLCYPSAIVIPIRAVQVTDRGPRVLTIRDGNLERAQVQVRDIVPVSIQKDDMLVSSGLEIGDRLIIAGGKGLVDGEEVRVIVVDGEPFAAAQPAAVPRAEAESPIRDASVKDEREGMEL